MKPYQLSPSSFIRTSLAATLLLCATSSMAQWQWLDDSGRKVYSDRPPPANIAPKNIIKHPGNNLAPVTVTLTDSKAPALPASQASQAAPAAAKPAASDPKAVAEKKKKEAEEAKQKKAEEEKAAKARAENCQRAKTALATLKSGARISTVNAKGEAQIMSDQNRAAEEKRLNSVISADCSGK